MQYDSVRESGYSDEAVQLLCRAPQIYKDVKKHRYDTTDLVDYLDNLLDGNGINKNTAEESLGITKINLLPNDQNCYRQTIWD
ncbi:14087_t:CDS:2 [Racocetra fulgida]|uniref:14087_t:CDS:1 n=1 Tax=Racocetra fulgida TaxID=60492 RepID=A0A9N9FF46_9GLOM|nr:14087_t:CDS:2 [Racocetra fulgida]